MASRKILDINYNGYKYKGYKKDDLPGKPCFSLYEVWWDCGEHKRLDGKYFTFYDMMCRVQQLSRAIV